jgi:hypothetical protein
MVTDLAVFCSLTAAATSAFSFDINCCLIF